MIIGIAGTIGAGKGTVVEYLKTKGFAHYSSSDVLKEILVERSLPTDRLHLSNLANELSAQQAGGVLNSSHQRAQEAGHQDYILEALHRVSEAEYIKEIGGLIIGVDANIQTRYDRISTRKEGEKDNVTFEQFVSDSEREDEGKTGSGPNIRAVLQMADYTLQNNGTLEELHAQVDDVLERINAAT